MATLQELQSRAKKGFTLADIQRGQQAKTIETDTAARNKEQAGKTAEDAVPKLFGSGFFGKLGNAITEAEQVTGKALSIFDKGLTKKRDAANEQTIKSQDRLLKLIREKRARGEDVSKERALLKSMGTDIVASGQEQGLDLTDRQVAGGVAGTAVDVAAAVASPLAGKYAAKGAQAPTFASRFLSGGARTAAVSAPEILSKSATGVAIEDKKLSENAPRIAAETLAGTGLAFLIGGVTAGVAGSLRERAEAKRAVREAIEAGDITDAKTAKFVTKSADKVDEAAVKIKTDKAAKEAIRQGVPERDVALLKALDDNDIEVAKDMTRLAEKASRDRTVIKRPMDMAGETAIKPAKHISDNIKTQAEELNTIAKGLKGKQVNGYDDLVTKFQDDVLDFGGSVTDDGIDFADSSFEDLGGNTKIIKNVYRRLKTANDAADLHRLKRYIDANVEYGKSAEGLVGDAERVLKGWRYAIDQTLDSQFSDYKAVNEGLSESIGALDDLNKIMGSKFRLSDPMADIRAGQVSSRLLSNSPNRGEVLQVLSTVDDVARRQGYAGKGDVVMQVNVADILEDIYGTQATRSFRGNIERAVDPTIINRARQGDLGVGEAAVKGAVQLFDNARNISQEGKEAAIKSLIGLSDDLPTSKVPASVGESIGDSMVENMRLAAEKAGKKSLAAKLAKVDTKGVTTASGLEERVMKAVGAGNMSQMEVKNWISTASQVFDDQAAKSSFTTNLAKNSQGGFLNIGGGKKLSQTDYDALVDFADHVEGVRKVDKAKVADLAQRAQNAADRAGIDGTGTNKTFAKKILEFLDDQGQVRGVNVKKKLTNNLFHGTSKEAAESIRGGGFNLENLGSNSKSKGVYGSGVYLTKNKEGAGLYGDDLIEVASDNLNLKKIDKDNILTELFAGDTKYGDPGEIAKKIMKEGFDGIDIDDGHEVVVFKPELLKPLSSNAKQPAATKYKTVTDFIKSGEPIKTGDDLVVWHNIAKNPNQPKGTFTSTRPSLSTLGGDKTQRMVVSPKKLYKAKNSADLYKKLFPKAPQRDVEVFDFDIVDTKIAEALKKKGYDAISYTDPLGSGVPEVVVLDKGIIKNSKTIGSRSDAINLYQKEVEKLLGIFKKK